jgi:hypothetical protein
MFWILAAINALIPYVAMLKWQIGYLCTRFFLYLLFAFLAAAPWRLYYAFLLL